MLQMHSTEYLRAELERTEVAIATCVIETAWTKNLREYKNTILAELDRRNEETK